MPTNGGLTPFEKLSITVTLATGFLGIASGTRLSRREN